MKLGKMLSVVVSPKIRRSGRNQSVKSRKCFWFHRPKLEEKNAPRAQMKARKNSMRIELDGYEPVQQEIDIRENQTTDLGTIALKPKKPVVAVAAAPIAPTVIPNAIYTGIIREKSGGAYGYNVPVSIAPAIDSKSGTMTQSAKSGDVVSKYTGVWDGKIFRGVTNEMVSKPAKVQWEPEAFSLQVSDDGKSARYECNADGKSYAADLTAQTLGLATAAKLSAIYNGTIVASGEPGGTPLAIAFHPDRKSGTITQTAKSGDVVVKFAGIWDGAILRAVTNEVVSKPAKVKWDPESFTLHFSEDGRNGSYECDADGKHYTAQLAPP